MTDNILGRGLGSLIPNRLNGEETDNGSVVSAIDRSEKVLQIPINQIESNPLQPRMNFDHSELEDLINSIKKHGILQPLIVTQKAAGSYQLIAGERRLRASEVLEMENVPCLIRKAKEMEKLELALIENVQRSDLNPIEEAMAYQKLVDDFSLTQEEVAEKVGKKRATISNILRILELPEEIKQALREKKITIGHAKVILSAEAESERIKIYKKILREYLTVRQTEDEVRKIKVKSGHKASEKDLEMADKEDRLRKSLNTKVSITKKGQNGQIIIEYYSLEELNNIVKKIIGEKE